MILDLLSDKLLAGKTAFVTGGGSGINLGIARTFAGLGADVAICGRTQEKLDAAAEHLRTFGNGVVTSVADVRDHAAVAAALEKSADALGPADVVVCGAAGNFVARAEDISANGFKTVVDIDLLGTFNASHAAFAQLRETRGNLLFISAAQAYLPFAYQAHVGAAKAGIDSLIRNLALEWGPYGIRCNSVAPGPIEGTEGMKRLEQVAGRETWTRMIPLGRYGTTEEIGAMAAVVVSPLGAFMTGTRIVVDGGQGLTGSSEFNNAVAAGLR
ncbi:SDR family oxidoreductase [Rhodococcoides fascians]|uniref:SDR family oxidoreductase n=1 Tax=Rhodococcoides fascians TaxID=1828 RepID=UPI0005692ECB|nr:SDR family oxidoreductase [Rhodococcus fascians]